MFERIPGFVDPFGILWLPNLLGCGVPFLPGLDWTWESGIGSRVFGVAVVFWIQMVREVGGRFHRVPFLLLVGNPC